MCCSYSCRAHRSLPMQLRCSNTVLRQRSRIVCRSACRADRAMCRTDRRQRIRGVHGLQQSRRNSRDSERWNQLRQCCSGLTSERVRCWPTRHLPSKCLQRKYQKPFELSWIVLTTLPCRSCPTKPCQSRGTWTVTT